MLAQKSVTVVVPLPDAEKPAVISQSPADSTIEVMLVATVDVADTVVAVAEMISPISPEAAVPLLASPGRCPRSNRISFVEFVMPVDRVNAPVLPAIDATEPADASDDTVTFFQAPDAA